MKWLIWLLFIPLVYAVTYEGGLVVNPSGVLWNATFERDLVSDNGSVYTNRLTFDNITYNFTTNVSAQLILNNLSTENTVVRSNNSLTLMMTRPDARAVIIDNNISYFNVDVWTSALVATEYLNFSWLYSSPFYLWVFETTTSVDIADDKDNTTVIVTNQSVYFVPTQSDNYTKRFECNITGNYTFNTTVYFDVGRNLLNATVITENKNISAEVTTLGNLTNFNFTGECPGTNIAYLKYELNESTITACISTWNITQNQEVTNVVNESSGGQSNESSIQQGISDEIFAVAQYGSLEDFDNASWDGNWSTKGMFQNITNGSYGALQEVYLYENYTLNYTTAVVNITYKVDYNSSQTDSFDFNKLVFVWKKSSRSYSTRLFDLSPSGTCVLSPGDVKNCTVTVSVPNDNIHDGKLRLRFYFTYSNHPIVTTNVNYYESNISTINKTVNSSIGVTYSQPGGQNNNCSFQIANDNYQTLRFEMLYNGTGYTKGVDYIVNGFKEIYGNFSTNETTWVNTTYNWTRLCFDAQTFIDNASSGLTSMRVRYNFNNTDNAVREYTNGTHWFPVNTTFGCMQDNYVRFNTTEIAYNFTYAFFDMKRNTEHNASVRLNITSGNGSVVSGYFEPGDNWTSHGLSLAGLNLSNVIQYEWLFNGTQTGSVLIDQFIFNGSTELKEFDFLAGNLSQNVSLTGSYQTVFDIPTNSTMNLLFWFRFNSTFTGAEINFDNLYYRESLI